VRNMNRRVFMLSSLGAVVFAQQMSGAQKPSPRSGKIILIGGKKSHGLGEHDFPNGIPLIASFLKGARPFRGTEILAFPNGWPAGLAELDGASTLVLYFDGVQQVPPPLLNPPRIAEVQKLIDAGAGLVCLHQASTVPYGDTTIPLVEWLGAKRNGMFDRTTESVNLKPETPSHPVCQGMTSFTYEDEFYPTLVFNRDAKRVVPILRANLPKEAPADHILAWAFERPNGGRSFGFTGGHYLASLKQPQIKKMILNAICWTSGRTVPPEGVAVESPAASVQAPRPADLQSTSERSKV
jgi:type 1 glutamine amidotransferase